MEAEAKVRSPLIDSAESLLRTCPAVYEMQGNPSFDGWAERLTAFADLPGLAPLSAVLKSVAADALVTFEPLTFFVTHRAGEVNWTVYLQASEVARSAVKAAPHAAFMLSLVSLLGWAYSLGRKGLYRFDDGMPHRGWAYIPYACALASKEVGGLEGAKQIVEESYDLLKAAKNQDSPELNAALTAYRELGGKILQSYEYAVADLAFDLRQSCEPGTHSFRAEVGAIAWTLGLIPESYLFTADARPGPLPSPRLFKLLVRRSLECIPEDPLTQYIWLEMKDRPPFSLRSHRRLFPKINARYGHTRLEGMPPFSHSPARAYASSLIRWFKGTLEGPDVAQFFAHHELVEQLSGGAPTQTELLAYVRMTGLATLLVKRSGLPPATFTREEQARLYTSLVNIAAILRENYNLHPEWPEIYSQPNFALHQLIEDELTTEGDAASTKSAGEVLETVERLRASALGYWLKVVRPFPPADEQAALGPLLRAEDMLMARLRAAYFLIIWPTLPHHYRLYGMLISGDKTKDIFKAAEEQQKLPSDSDTGRERYSEIESKLDSLFNEMCEVAPVYGRSRRNPASGMSDLIAAISGHASPRQY